MVAPKSAVKSDSAFFEPLHVKICRRIWPVGDDNKIVNDNKVTAMSHFTYLPRSPTESIFLENLILGHISHTIIYSKFHLGEKLKFSISYRKVIGQLTLVCSPL